MKFIISTVFAKISILKIRILNSAFSNSFLGKLTIFSKPNISTCFGRSCFDFRFLYERRVWKKPSLKLVFSNTNFRKHCSWIYSVFVILINIELNCIILNCSVLHYIDCDLMRCIVLWCIESCWIFCIFVLLFIIFFSVKKRRLHFLIFFYFTVSICFEYCLMMKQLYFINCDKIKSYNKNINIHNRYDVPIIQITRVVNIKLE